MHKSVVGNRRPETTGIRASSDLGKMEKSLFRSDFPVGKERVTGDRREDVEIFGSEFDCSDDCAVGIVNHFVEHNVYLTFYIYYITNF